MFFIVSCCRLLQFSCNEDEENAHPVSTVRMYNISVKFTVKYLEISVTEREVLDLKPLKVFENFIPCQLRLHIVHHTCS